MGIWLKEAKKLYWNNSKQLQEYMDDCKSDAKLFDGKCPGDEANRKEIEMDIVAMFCRLAVVKANKL